MAEAWEWEAEIESVPAMACSFARGNQEGQIVRDALAKCFMQNTYSLPIYVLADLKVRSWDFSCSCPLLSVALIAFLDGSYSEVSFHEDHSFSSPSFTRVIRFPALQACQWKHTCWTEKWSDFAVKYAVQIMQKAILKRSAFSWAQLHKFVHRYVELCSNNTRGRNKIKERGAVWCVLAYHPACCPTGQTLLHAYLIKGQLQEIALWCEFLDGVMWEMSEKVVIRWVSRGLHLSQRKRGSHHSCSCKFHAAFL